MCSPALPTVGAGGRSVWYALYPQVFRFRKGPVAGSTGQLLDPGRGRLWHNSNERTPVENEDELSRLASGCLSWRRRRCPGDCISQNTVGFVGSVAPARCVGRHARSLSPGFSVL